MASSKSQDCHWPLRVQMTEASCEARGVREQESLVMSHIHQSRGATRDMLFLGAAMDKASVRGLDLCNTIFTLPNNKGFEALPQVAVLHVYIDVLYLPTCLPTHLLTHTSTHPPT